MTRKHKIMLARIVISAVSVVVLNLIPIKGLIRLSLFLLVYLIIGYDILRKAAKGIINGSLFNEDFLMAIATVGAFAIAIYDNSGDYNEAIAVMLFYQIGELFQSIAVRKSRNSIKELMDIRPDYANIEENGNLLAVDPESVAIGSIIIVQPGEKIPIDGVVIEGESSLNTAALTGESLPREVAVGDEIISGCININGLLKIRTTKEFGESTVCKILELVENASSKKSKSERFISKFARYYTPAVCGAALVLAVLPPALSLVFGGEALWMDWVYRALTFLVISCPCALVISIPLSFFAGIGGAGKKGILIKGSNFIEALSQVKYAVFDKTGTLTEGIFEVTDILHNTIAKEKLLELSAHAECASSHPIAKSLEAAYGGEIDRARIENIEEIAGKGVIATIDGTSVAVGNKRLMESLNISCPEGSDTGASIHVAVGGAYGGLIVISDKIKPDSKAALAELRKSGIEKTVMLTGDSEITARAVASEIGIDEVYSELLPADKVEIIEKLLSESRENGKLAYLGDGINDAPVLARADIGIAMGGMGSDAAIEAADIVLMEDDPRGLAEAIRISRKCMGIVRENIVFSLLIKFGCLALVAAGVANMWFGIFADVGVMVLAVLNAIRAMH